MRSRLDQRSRPGRPSRAGRGGSGGSGGGGGSSFFGAQPALVEVWAEDPSQTPPANNGTIGNWRDNGSTGGNWVGGNTLRYVDGSADGINSLPAFDHSHNAGSVFDSPLAATAPPYTCVAVSRFNNVSGSQYIHDDQNAGQDCAVYLTGGNLSLYATGGQGTITGPAGVTDTVYLTVAQYATNDFEFWVNNVSAGTDTSGTPGTNAGFHLGASYGNTFGIDGCIAYAAVISGTVASQTDWSSYISAIMSHYGIS